MRHAPAAALLALAGGCGAALAPEGTPPLAEADFGRPWVLIDRVGSGKTIDAITHGGGEYVAITHVETLDSKAMPSRNNIAAVSSDGLSWSEAPIEPDGHYRSIAYGAGRFVAAGGVASGGGPGLILSSTDGRQWSVAGRASERLQRIRYTASGFVAVGATGAVLTSGDGTTWNESLDPGRGMLWDGTIGGGRLVAVGQTLAVGSSGGRTWSAVPCGAALPCLTVVDPSGGNHAILQLYAVEFGNGVFVAEGVAGLLRSPDGLTWTRQGDTRDPLTFAGGQFLSLAPVTPGDRNGRSFRVAASADGQSWADRTTAVRGRTDDSCATSRCLLLPAALLLVPPAP